MRQALAVVGIGMGIGWLVGLSSSPVVSVVLGSLLGIAGGLVAGLRATEAKEKVDAVPAAILVLGIAAAATLGMMTRSHEWLGPESTPDRVELLSVLFSQDVDLCLAMVSTARRESEDILRVELRQSGGAWAELESAFGDVDRLRAAVKEAGERCE